jgi:predicted dehydrogenase
MPICDQYTLQAEAFSRAVRGEAKLEYGMSHAIGNMKAIDALFRAADSGKWEKI